MAVGPLAVAATNKCSARNNKSRTRVPATIKRPLNGKPTLCKACKAICQRFRGHYRRGRIPSRPLRRTPSREAGTSSVAEEALEEGEGVPSKTGEAPVTDPAEQLRLVMGARFEKRRLLSRSEAQVLYAAERAINTADLKWRVMAQVSLGEVLSSPDARAYSAINSKRVDLLIVSRSGDPIAAIEYQGHGHYQGTAAARDAVKKEALRKAGVRYIAVTPESGTEDMAREISRIAQGERLSPILP